MIGLAGDLSAFSCIDLFQFLGFVRARGVLVLSRGREQARVFFDEGRIVAVVAERSRPRLGAVLLALGTLGESALEEGLAQMRAAGCRLGEALVDAGLLTAENLEQALQEQLSRTLYGLLRWNEGMFEFSPGGRPAADLMRLKTPLDRLLFEGLRRMDEETSEERPRKARA